MSNQVGVLNATENARVHIGNIYQTKDMLAGSSCDITGS